LSQGFYVAESAPVAALTDGVGEQLTEAMKKVTPVLLEIAEAAEAINPTTTTQDTPVTVNAEDGPQLKMDLSEDEKTELEIQEQGVLSMEITENALDELIDQKVNAGVESAQAKVLQPEEGLNGTEEKPVELARILKALGQEDFQDRAEEELTKFYLEQEKAMQERASQVATMRLANIRRKSDIAEFSQSITGGTPDYPRGLPVAADKVNAFLLSLKPDQAVEAQEIFSAIQRTGLTEFNARGHDGRRTGGTVELDAPIAESLKDWIASGQSVSEFFKVNANVLGDQEQYNLNAFRSAEEKE
jgi:hypothetical protein